MKNFTKVIILSVLISGIVIGSFFVFGGSLVNNSQSSHRGIATNVDDVALNTNDQNEAALNSAGTSAYKSKNLGYSLVMPKGWYNFSLSDVYTENNNGSDQDYFSNEDISSPFSMSTNGVWITIERTLKSGQALDQFIQQRSVNKAISQVSSLKIDNFSAISQFESPLPGYDTEAGYDSFVYVDAGDYFYVFSILTPSSSSYQQNLPEINTVTHSFAIVK